MAIMWLVCVPFGLIILLGYSFCVGSKRGNIEFDKTHKTEICVQC